MMTFEPSSPELAATVLKSYFLHGGSGDHDISDVANSAHTLLARTLHRLLKKATLDDATDSSHESFADMSKLICCIQIRFHQQCC